MTICSGIRFHTCQFCHSIKFHARWLLLIKSLPRVAINIFFSVWWYSTPQDGNQLMNLLTYEAVETAVQKRVEMKAKTFGLQVPVNPDEADSDPAYKIKPNLVADLYGNWIMPLTKEVQVQYLLRRLD